MTNIGSIGLEQGFAPIPSPAHPSMVGCIGKITKKAVVVDDKIVIREMMNCIYTIDHRHGDAAILCQFLKIVKDLLENPDTFNADNYPELPSYEEIANRKKVN